jgi:hypothetical protein
MIQASEIEWTKYPVSETTLTSEQARIALNHERATFGSSISQVTPEGESRVLVNGQWHRVVDSQ